VAGDFITKSFRLTSIGGYAVKLQNQTGAASVKGTLVEASSGTDLAVNTITADAVDCIGVIYEDGVANGSDVWVVVGGVAEVLLEDGTAATRDYWVRTSETDAGRADATNAAPPGGTVAAIEEHLAEIGHCLETVSSGTDVLCKILMHFN